MLSSKILFGIHIASLWYQALENAVELNSI